MAVTQPKKTLSKDEIIDILRRNARLFKDEPDFVNYIVDLAMYLLEEMLDLKAENRTPATRFKATSKDIKDIHKVFDRFTTAQASPRMCPICGSPVEGKRKCPNCDSMTF